MCTCTTSTSPFSHRMCTTWQVRAALAGFRRVQVVAVWASRLQHWRCAAAQWGSAACTMAAARNLVPSPPRQPDHAKRAMSEFPLCRGRYYGVDYGCDAIW